MLTSVCKCASVDFAVVHAVYAHINFELEAAEALHQLFYNPARVEYDCSDVFRSEWLGCL